MLYLYPFRWFPRISVLTALATLH